MMKALERVIRGAYDRGVPGATDEAADFDASRGWRLWRDELPEHPAALSTRRAARAGCAS
jgi:hypothetical protein